MKWLIELIKKWMARQKPEPKPEPDKPVDNSVDPLEDAILPADIRWLGDNVGAWQKKYSLQVSLNNTQIIYDQQGTSVWTPMKTGGGENLVGNPWVIAKLNGQWTGANHEWFRASQKIKGKVTVAGDHIKRREFGDDWKPTVGEQYGFVVTGLARCTVRNQRERTQIVMVTWK
jgi:hypothetical protein